MRLLVSSSLEELNRNITRKITWNITRNIARNVSAEKVQPLPWEDTSSNPNLGKKVHLYCSAAECQKADLLSTL